MNFNDKDRLTDLERLVSTLFTETRGIARREVNGAQPLWLEFTAAGLIDAAGPGAKVNVLGLLGVKNVTGHPIWKGSRCLVWGDPSAPKIVFSNAATVIALTYDTGTATLVASYDASQAANGAHFDDEDLDDTHFEIFDPLGLLTGIAENDIITFATGGQDDDPPNTLTAVELVASGTASGGGSLPWSGFPTTPDPTTGTTTMVAFRALVNATAGVASSDATFAFDGGTAQIGTHATDGTCVNKRPAAFVDNEPIEVFKNPSGTFYAIKIGGNRIVAQVDGTPAGGEFDLDGASITALEGPVPHADQRVAKVLSGQTWADDDWGLFELDDDGLWSGVKLLESAAQVRMGLLIADIAAASTITYSGGTTATVTPGTQADAVLLLQGEPAGLTGELLCVGVNYSKQAREGDTTHPVVVLGKYYPEVGETPAKFVLDPQDLRQQNGWTLAADQSIGHDASGQPLWQDDTDECPE